MDVALLPTEPHAVVVPSLAVQAGQQGPFVFVIDAQSQAEMRPVTVARIEGDESVIASGITPGEVVVTDGQLRLGRRGSLWHLEDRRAHSAAGGGLTKPMNLSEIFIQRPVATTLIIVAIVMFGAMGYRQLPVSDLPTVDFPTIQVEAGLPGASPETMATAVATPLEKQFSAIAGVDSISSTNGQGRTNITIQFSLDRNIDAAAQDVQSMIARALRQLPPGMPNPPSLQKMNPADSPVLFLSVMSDTLPLSQVNEYAETILAQRLSTVTGVAQVNIQGAQKFAVRIDVDPRELASRQIGIDEVADAVGRRQREPAHRHVERHGSGFCRRVERAPDAGRGIQADRRGLPQRVAGAPVRTGQCVRRRRERQDRRLTRTARGRCSCRFSGSPGPTPSQVVDSIVPCCRACRSSCRRRSPSASAATGPQSIRESVADVKFTLLLTVGLVVLVIFLFLRNLSATVIPSLALPVSVVGTFAVMYVFGYSLDNLSLMALTLAVGFVVDDAIVMLENIVRHMEMGKSPMEAAFDGSREVAFTILSMTALAGGGVHSGAVHGRHRRPPAARVRGDDRGRDPGLRASCRSA